LEIPHLQAVFQDFGVPRAVVRDLGRAASGAVATVLALCRGRNRPSR